jgi:hypothetical protein
MVAMHDLTLGPDDHPYISATTERPSAPAPEDVSVPAPIAVSPAEANDSGMRGLRIAACVVALATATELTVGALHVLEVIPSEQEDWIPLSIYPFIALAFLAPTVVGLLIAFHQPRNTIAWILLLGAFAPTLQLSAEQLVGPAWSFQSEAATLPLLFAWPVAIAFFFPDGRLISRRWRWVVLGAGVSFGATILLKLFDPEAYPPPNQEIRNPVLGNDFGQFVVDTGLWIPFALGVLASLFAAVIAVVVRFPSGRRCSLRWR